MKFSCSVDVNIPTDKAVALYTDPRYFKEWQDGFISYEPVEVTLHLSYRSLSLSNRSLSLSK
jgi:hypothetical protein